MALRSTVLAVLTSGLLWAAQQGFAGEDPLLRARTLLERKAYSEALEAAREGVKLDGKDPEARGLEGDALAGLERWDEAATAYEEALRLMPSEDLKARCVLGVSRALLRSAEHRLDEGEPVDALEILNDAIIWDIDFIEALLLRSTVLERLGRAEEAEDEFRTALRKAPRDPAALRHGALLYARKRRFEEALPLLDRLIAGTTPPAEPGTLAWAHMTVGKIHLEEGERGRGYRHIRLASELAPRNEEARRILANLEAFRKQAGRVTRAENFLLLACLAVLLLYGGIGLAGWRILRRKGWV